MGETEISGGKPCQKIVGYDDNALYIWAIGQDMPEGMFMRCRADNHFKPEFRDKYMQPFNWLNYLIKHEARNIKNLRNNGKEVKIGKYPILGYDAQHKTVYQYHGCYYHGPDCYLTKGISDETWRKERASKLERTRKTTASIHAKGFKCVEMLECRFHKFVKDHPALNEIIYKSRPAFSQQCRGRSVTEHGILKAVHQNILFGMVEVDIDIPDNWHAPVTHHGLSPYNYFAEMCPLFCNTEVSFDDIRKHMQDHVTEFGLSNKSHRHLVGGLKAQQMLIATPLLKWYMKHRLVVTKINQSNEFRRQASFKTFVLDVSDAR